MLVKKIKEDKGRKKEDLKISFFFFGVIQKQLELMIHTRTHTH